MITKLAQKLIWSSAIFASWLVLAFGFSAVPGFTHKVDVYFPSEKLLNDPPNDVSIVAITKTRATFASPRSDLAFSLYRAGARLLLTSEANGCLDLRGLVKASGQ